MTPAERLAQFKTELFALQMKFGVQIEVEEKTVNWTSMTEITFEVNIECCR